MEQNLRAEPATRQEAPELKETGIALEQPRTDVDARTHSMKTADTEVDDANQDLTAAETRLTGMEPDSPSSRLRGIAGMQKERLTKESADVTVWDMWSEPNTVLGSRTLGPDRSDERDPRQEWNDVLCKRITELGPPDTCLWRELKQSLDWDLSVTAGCEAASARGAGDGPTLTENRQGDHEAPCDHPEQAQHVSEA